MVVWLALACSPPVAETDDTDVVETDDTAAAGPDVRVVPTDASAFAETTLGLYPLDTSFFAVTSETPALEVPQGTDGAFEFAFVPDAAALQDAPWASGVKVASYAMLAWDGEATNRVGIARMDAVYFEGALPQPFLDVGLHEGWNVFRADDEGPPIVGDPLAVALEPNLISVDALTVGGDWSTTVGGLVTAVSTEDPAVGLGTAPAADPWSLSVSGEPPLSTRFATTDVTVAGFRLTAVTDADADGAFDAEDPVTARGVSEATGEPAWVTWGAPVSSAHEAHVLVTRGGFRVGWSAVRGVEGSTPLAADDTIVLAAP